MIGAENEQQEIERAADVRHAPPKVNVGNRERLISVAAALPLLQAGIRSERLGALGRIATAGLGGICLYRGLTGTCALNSYIGRNTAGTLAERGVRVEQSISVRKEPQEVYRFWRDYDNLVECCENLVSVREEGTRSYWVATSPSGRRIEWVSELIDDQPGHLISWQTTEDSQVLHAGSVRFSPGPRGTIVRVLLECDMIGGQVLSNVLAMFGRDLNSLVRADLQRVKERLERNEFEFVKGETSIKGIQ